MQLTHYLTLEEVLLLHTRLIERYGGAMGVRDLGLVESALARPRSGYYETQSEQAAALLQSLALNHGFVDGNKRVAFAACAVFLHMNGYHLRATADEVEGFLIERLIGASADLPQIADWVESHLVSRNDDG